MRYRRGDDTTIDHSDRRSPDRGARYSAGVAEALRLCGVLLIVATTTGCLHDGVVLSGDFSLGLHHVPCDGC
ncbi:MAG: hypothetical protein KDA63_20525, partial [Planctomycetales bacterium]|nr:hypothetical protein [Planctomycetales bacterium]